MRKRKVLGILACGSSKAWDKQPGLGELEAQQAYTGTLFRKARAYAEKYCDQWVVLSAKYGFLWPTDIVEGPYDVTYTRPSEEVIALSQLKQQVEVKRLLCYKTIVVLGGRKYGRVISQVFGKEHTLEFPLDARVSGLCCKGSVRPPAMVVREWSSALNGGYPDGKVEQRTRTSIGVAPGLCSAFELKSQIA